MSEGAIPERDLWFAVLRQALEDFRYRGREYEKIQNGFKLRGWYVEKDLARERRLAKQWFASESESAGSFLWVCDYLGVDPCYVRMGLKKFGRTSGRPEALH